MRNTLSFVGATLAIATITACSVHSDKAEVNDGGVKVGFGTDSASREPAMGPGDVKITSTENTVVLSVIGDTVRFQLSDSLRNSVAKEVDSAAGEKGALASAIIKGVSGVVRGAMGFTVRVHVNDVENLRYENGHILFDVRNSNTNINSSSSNSDHSKDKAMFSEADAQRFIDTVHRRQKRKVEQ